METPTTTHPPGQVSPPVRSEELIKVCAEQDRAREVLRQRMGEIKVAVDLVREARDE